MAQGAAQAAQEGEEMSITDELREYALGWDERNRVRRELTAIADRIDAEHEAKVSYWQGASYKDGYDEGFASADDWLAQHEDAMAEHGWVRLPKDADGEPIRVGDVMEYTDKPTEPLTVSYIELEKNGWWVFTDGMGRRPDKYRHHHAPTVEDVLREMHEKLCEVVALYVGEAIDSDERDHDEVRIFAEYAAKLSLAGDAE